MKNIKIPIPNKGVQIQGHYQVEINFTEKNDPVGCFFLDFCLG